MCSSPSVASAGTPPRRSPSSPPAPSGCRKVAFTADGGYFSGGEFFWEPGDDVTLITHWCYGHGIVRSHSVTFTTTIANSRITTNTFFAKGHFVLNVQLSADYPSGVGNNTGEVTISGHVTGGGGHHFENDSKSAG
jgi:hypothetical protein